MDDQYNRARTTEQKATAGSSQDDESGQAGAKPDPQGTTAGAASEGKPAANAAEAGPDATSSDERTGAGTGARAGEYS